MKYFIDTHDKTKGSFPVPWLRLAQRNVLIASTFTVATHTNPATPKTRTTEIAFVVAALRDVGAVTHETHALTN